jgi:DNA repair protein RadA/Sms
VAKARTVFVCRSCGSAQHRWAGKCPDCGAWSSLEEQRVDHSAARDPQRGVLEGWTSPTTATTTATTEPTAALGADRAARQAAVTAAAAGEASAPGVAAVSSATALPITMVEPGRAELRRLPSGIGELDRVLGGTEASGFGLVPGSVVLIGGEPGIGKSTLLLQAAGSWAERLAPSARQSDWTGRVLYCTSEESAEQVRARAQRLGVGQAERLFVLADTNLARIVEQTRRVMPDVLIIDSIQMVYKADLDASPGSVAQLRRCASELVYLAKLSGIAVVLVGHVTKDGQLAGPRLLEHLVDAVVSFEGDRHHATRIVRAIKNRFGTTLELGLFEMTGAGLRELPEGASVAALDGADDPRPGAAVVPAIHGTRCVLVEVQALTATGFLGAAKRKSSGLDASRLAMLIAVLEQHAGLRLADRDIFASSVGGLKVVEPAADVATLLAIAGAHFRKAMPTRTVAIGEVGLGGEVRAVAQLEQRLREAARLGYTRAIVPAPPKAAVKGANQAGPDTPRSARAILPKIDGLELDPVRNIDRAIERLS